MTDKEVKRGYVKWTDDDGVFHKEPLINHPELLAKASPAEQLAAEEVRRLNASAEEDVEEDKEEANENIEEVLEDLKKAPEDVLTASQLINQDIPASGAEEVDEDTSPEHQEALARLRAATS